MLRIRFDGDRDSSIGRFNRIALLSEPHEPRFAPRCFREESARRPDLKLKSIDLINMLRFLETVTHESDITETQVQAFLAENDPHGGNTAGEFGIDTETDDDFFERTGLWP